MLYAINTTTCINRRIYYYVLIVAVLLHVELPYMMRYTTPPVIMFGASENFLPWFILIRGRIYNIPRR